MKPRYQFIFITSLLFLTSCDCYQRVQGKVVDLKSGLPLENVSVSNPVKENFKTETDSLGQFELAGISGGFSCPPMSVVVEKAGFKRLETSIPAGGFQVIKLEKSE
ncbi:carboxypeptidase regulatory-like domain-containing protein [Rufibacter roseolus]|uniref:carboxypeptidase regulatory-like domain-containing protein n=1 Tax=Rufibacter roseolus TaxID=2817375 RepID=UPI001B30357C|nr:carboxypeptidase regulatory-like domain-containing protein [Rufibacter roseolus]